MKTRKSTYDLLVESEDKSRTVIESVIYMLFVLSAVISIAQFAMQPVIVPGSVAMKTAETHVQASI
jgi:hypothetical protein